MIEQAHKSRAYQ